MQETSKLLNSLQGRRIAYTILTFLIFSPLFTQLITVNIQNYAVSLLTRITVHILIPVVIASWFWRQNIWQAFTAPLKTKDKVTFYWSLKIGMLGGLAALVIIVGAFLVFEPLLNLSSIKASLEENFQVTKQTYPFIALAIILGTPFLEEYFWRGFIYRSFSALAQSKKTKYLFMVLTGFFFAIHHVVIISNWFNWWQFLLTVVFLGIVGILFNWMFEKSNSILPGYLTHLIADIVIVMIGFHLFEYF